MAIPVHKIGDQQFLRIDGELPTGLVRRLEVQQRPGVDGTAIWDAGLKGREFTLTTTVDQASIDDARTTFAAYRNMIRGQYALEWGDYDFLNEAFEVFVLHVRPGRMHLQPAKTIVGGLNVDDGDDGFFLHAVWTLIEVEP